MPKQKQKNNAAAGKGDKPRNCFSKEFQDNYDEIEWGDNRKQKKPFRRKKTY